MSNSTNTKPAAEPAAPKQSSSDQPFELSIEDTAAQLRRGIVPPGGHPAAVGYNPYDVAPSAGGRPDKRLPLDDSKPVTKPSDLRKLSEWIKMQRRVQELKEQAKDEEPGSGS